MSTRYVIVGAGAVGAILATRLHQAGLDYLLVGRGETIRRIIEDGLRYVVHGEERRVPLKAAMQSDGVGLRLEDVLVFATKTQDLEAAVTDWAWLPVDGGGTASRLPALSVQNGLDADRILLRRFDRVIAGTILTPAQHLEAGRVLSGAYGPSGILTLGPAASPGVPLDQIESVAADLRTAGYLVEVRNDVARWKAAKLIFSVRNGLEIFSGTEENRARFTELLIDETRAVLRAVEIDPARPEERHIDVSSFVTDPASGIVPGQQSTWQSVTRGVRNEADFLNGEVAFLGRLHGIPTPANVLLQEALGRASVQGERPGSRDIADLLAELEGVPA